MGAWRHVREPAPVDAQTVIRLNRDTLYSTCLVNLSGGAHITLPEAGGRYQTAMVVNEDHYINRVLDTPGRHALSEEEIGTPYALVAVRTLVEAPSCRPFAAPEYDEATLTATRQALLELARGLPDARDTFGSREQTDPVRHLIGTAAGWGGLPSDQAYYLGVEPGLPAGHHVLHIGEVPVRGFWSISVYNRDGYFEPNPLGRYGTAVRDADGAVTVSFGGDPSAPNHIPVMDGWNYTVRLYQPDPAILHGTWTFPALDAPAP